MQVLRASVVERAVLDLAVLGLEMGHGARTPVAAILVNVSTRGCGVVFKRTEFAQMLMRSSDDLCSGKSCNQIWVNCQMTRAAFAVVLMALNGSWLGRIPATDMKSDGAERFEGVTAPEMRFSMLGTNLSYENPTCTG